MNRGNMSNLSNERDNWRYQEFKVDPFFFQITFGFITIVLAVLIGFALFPDDTGYRSNLYTTAVGILITISLLDLLARRREDTRAKAQLIREMGNVDNGIVARAIAELSANKWGFEGDTSLNKAYLHGANLRGTKLTRANLADANLGFAQLQNSSLDKCNLQNAFLRDARLMHSVMIHSNLQNANLHNADLREAHMAGADLRGAKLEYADLEGTIFWGTDLRSTNLLQANLIGASLVNTIANHEAALFDETTILPDGTCWTPTTDMRRFTNPRHPEFWQSMIVELREDRRQNKI